MKREYKVIGQIADSASSVAVEPAFSDEVQRRLNRKATAPASDSDLLRDLATLIAYSQNARSDLVSRMIDAGGLESAFGDFDPSRVAALDPETVLQQHWKRIRPIRFRRKVASIIGVASSLERLRGCGFDLGEHLRSLPPQIQKPADVTDFWRAFDSLQERFRTVGMPFFSRLTSLLHLYLDFGFDCLKPDVVVQSVAIETGLLPPNPRERDLRQLVETVQEYSLWQHTRPGVVDFYFLVYGGQTWAKQFVKAQAPRIDQET